jgi:hypothetical protein
LRLAAAFLAIALLAGPARAEEALPARNQALLLLRVLAYDRALRARAGEAATIGVAFRPGDGPSESARDAMVLELTKAAESFSVAGLPVRVVAVPWARGGPAPRLPAGPLAALYVAPGLESEAAAIARETRARKVLTFTVVRASVDAGLSVGLASRGSRAGLVLNRTGVRAEGADLDSALLAIAEVIEGNGGPRP